MMDAEEHALHLKSLKKLLQAALEERWGYALQLELKDRQVEYLHQQIALLEGVQDDLRVHSDD